MSVLEKLGVARVLRPASPAEVAAMLGDCASRGETVLPVGAGSALSAAGAPDPCHVALALEGLDGIVDYSPGDMTITVLAGTSLDTIRKTVAEHGQRLPGLPKEGTIGGLAATGRVAAAACQSQGSLRERLLGTQIADASGRLTRSGGRVVKNVTGYDLHRMYVGTGGAFGVFTELTFRLEPEPEHRTVVMLEAASAEVAREAWRWLRWDGPDAAFLWVRPGAGASLEFVALLEGDEEPARGAARDLAQGWSRFGPVEERDSTAGSRPIATGGTHRLVIALGGVPKTLPLLETLRADESLRRVTRDWACYPQSMQIRLDLAGSAEDLTARLRAFAESAPVPGPAYRIQEESPAFLPHDLPRWSGDPGPLRALARIKRALDPAGILRPGSYSADTLERSAKYFLGMR